ncbi:MAG: class I SAM-dependent methyltransferase [bacterium]|nr:class I SAM-dependent methyltransferase [bacterium]
MRSDILQYYGSINAAFLHAYAEAGTEFLLQELMATDDEIILELGCGTGGTLVKLKSRIPGLQLFGIDGSETMVSRSRSRLRFCGISPGISLQTVNLHNPLPFNDNTFHKIYAESVLGIQAGEQLQVIFCEILRVLKPGGKLVLNETVWLDAISAQEIETINDSCKKIFGIVQANSAFPTRRHWLQLMRSSGFSEVRAEEISPVKSKIRAKVPELLSKLFSMFGKIRKLRPSLRRESAAYKIGSKSIYGNKRYMEGVLFSAVK